MRLAAPIMDTNAGENGQDAFAIRKEQSDCLNLKRIESKGKKEQC
jgi:hypothetical protein